MGALVHIRCLCEVMLYRATHSACKKEGVTLTRNTTGDAINTGVLLIQVCY